MKLSFRALLVLVLTALLAVSTVAYADPENENGRNDPSQPDAQKAAPSRERTYYWDPFAHYFRVFGISGAVALNVSDESADAFPVDNSDIMPDEAALLCAHDLLSGHVIGIDPGHQLSADYMLEQIAPGSIMTKIRQSAGCIGIRSCAPEYRINLLVADKLRELLESCGATVVITHTEADVSISNMERAIMMNESGADIWLRLHCNASADSTVSGACVLIPSVETTPDIYDLSYILGLCLSAGYSDVEGNGAAVGLVPLDNQAGFNWSQIPVAAIEMGYLSNYTEDAHLNSDSYQMRCAIGIFNGIIGYYTELSMIDAEDGEAQPDMPEPDGQAGAQPDGAQETPKDEE